jgi:hypothetical protein
MDPDPLVAQFLECRRRVAFLNAGCGISTRFNVDFEAEGTPPRFGKSDLGIGTNGVAADAALRLAGLEKRPSF